MLDYFSKHFIILNHQVPYFGVKRVLGVWIRQDVNQSADYACQSDRGCKVLSNQGKTDVPFVTDVRMVESAEAA